MYNFYEVPRMLLSSDPDVYVSEYLFHCNRPVPSNRQSGGQISIRMEKDTSLINNESRRTLFAPII
jgi:hypothetical protein